MKRLAFLLSLFTIPVAAQPVPLQQQLDSMTVTVNRAVMQMSGQIAMDQEKIAALTKQLADVTKERDELAKPPKP